MTAEIARLYEGLAVYSPEVVILPTSEDVDRYASNIYIEQSARNPHSIMTLPTGNTQIEVYRLWTQAGLDLSALTVFNLDEYWKLPESHPANYASYMRNNFLRHVNIPATQCHIPFSNAHDPLVEASAYDAVLSSHKVDLAVLGLGPGTTCHMGFNERGSLHTSRTRYVMLDAQTIETNRQYFENPLEMPQGAITQGVGNILEASRIMLIAKGEGKAWGVWRSLQGPVGPDAPASYLRLHPHVVFVIDQAAAHFLTYNI